MINEQTIQDMVPFIWPMEAEERLLQAQELKQEFEMLMLQYPEQRLLILDTMQKISQESPYFDLIDVFSVEPKSKHKLYDFLQRLHSGKIQKGNIMQKMVSDSYRLYNRNLLTYQCQLMVLATPYYKTSLSIFKKIISQLDDNILNFVCYHATKRCQNLNRIWFDFDDSQSKYNELSHSLLKLELMQKPDDLTHYFPRQQLILIYVLFSLMQCELCIATQLSEESQENPQLEPHQEKMDEDFTWNINGFSQIRDYYPKLAHKLNKRMKILKELQYKSLGDRIKIYQQTQYLLGYRNSSEQIAEQNNEILNIINGRKGNSQVELVLLVSNAKIILMVGVGGIGCEVLKILSKFTFQEFHIIDMDTIEVSNLNRQFLFRQEHRGQSKAIVAAQTMLKMAPQLKIVAHHAAINSPGYTMDFFRQFDAVIMALDNADTRSYVNKVCHALGIFIVDAGSMGFKAQAKAYYGPTECYDCYPIATTQKQYPACTIRSQPTNCTHCVIWAKYLFTQLFSGEIGILEIEGFDKTQPTSVFNKFFQGEEMPIQIHIVDYEPIAQYHFSERSETLNELQGMWFYAYSKLFEQGQIEYDKDDELHVLFIYASTALRCRNFNIKQYDYQNIKTISGNIIHAIASTNSIVSAFEVIKLIHFIENCDKITYYHELSGPTYYTTNRKERIVPGKISKSNPMCNSCFTNQIITKINFNNTTVYQLSQALKNHFNTQINIVHQARIIWDDEEEDDNEAIQNKLLSSLFNLELDNRLIIKSIQEKLLAVLWLKHDLEGNVLEFNPTMILDKTLRLKQPLQEKKRERVRNRQESKEFKETLELPQKNTSIKKDNKNEICLDDENEEKEANHKLKQINEILID